MCNHSINTLTKENLSCIGSLENPKMSTRRVNCILLGYYAASHGNFLLTFQDEVLIWDPTSFYHVWLGLFTTDSYTTTFQNYHMICRLEYSVVYACWCSAPFSSCNLWFLNIFLEQQHGLPVTLILIPLMLLY